MLIGKTQKAFSWFYQDTRPQMGSKIANSKGVPGTLGCIIHDKNYKQAVLLTNWHVLFGKGGAKGGLVWLVEDTNGTRQYWKLGRTLHGKFGTFCFEGKEHHIDCAVSSFQNYADIRQTLPDTLPDIYDYDTARPGDLVIKTGAATGITVGKVVEVNASENVRFSGRDYSAPGQLRVQPLNNYSTFSASGDSGSVLVNERKKAVGLLWGANCRGEGLACPIAPVFHAMNFTSEKTQAS